MGLATANEPRSSMIVFYMKKKGGRDPKLCGKSDDNFSSDLELEYTHKKTQKHANHCQFFTVRTFRRIDITEKLHKKNHTTLCISFSGTQMKGFPFFSIYLTFEV